MKLLFLLFTALLIETAKSQAGELDSIALLTPVSYDKKSSSFQTLKSKALVKMGDMTNTDVVATVKEQIEPQKKDLVQYFSNSAELDKFIDSIVLNGKNATIGNDFSDKNLIRFFEYIGNKLIGGIADKALLKNGVIDSKRRELWVNKMLNPFQACIKNSSNAMYDAKYCVDALKVNLIPSAGVGIVYELSKDKLSSSLPDSQKNAFIINQTVSYKTCLKKTAGESNDVTNCAVQSMQDGVLKVTDLKLSKIITSGSSSVNSAKTNKQIVWPSFSSCIQKVGMDKNNSTALDQQFFGCLDSLVENTGSQLVSDQLTNKAEIKANLKKDEIAQLATEQVQVFKNCLALNKQNNIRKEGILDTDSCEAEVRNNVTYKIVVKKLADTAQESFKGDTDTIKKLSQEGKGLLDQCWAKDQSPKQLESCLKKTIVAYGTKIGTIKLDHSIPSKFSIKTELTRNSLRDLAACLEKQLPEKVSEAPNLSKYTDPCSNKITRNVALQVALESVKMSASENKIAPKDTQILLSNFVESKFFTCLGSAPTDLKIDQCSGDLRKNVAISMASTRIRASAAGKVNNTELESLISLHVNKNFSECIGSNPTDSVLDKCVAGLTREATKSIVLMYEKKQIKDQLNTDIVPERLKTVENDFVVCTQKPYPVAMVSKSIDECTKQFSLSFARVLGDIKLNSIMKSVLGLNAYNDQKNNINFILNKYNNCLDDLNKYTLDDGLLDKLTFCTDGLERRGLQFVSNTVNTWMSSEEKDAATLMVKSEFANFIPCLGGLMPSSPYDEKMQANADSILKPASVLISQYIEYSPGDAKRSLDQIIKLLSSDLKDVASNPNSRLALIDTLYKNGALDQFLKSLVLAQLKTEFEKMSEADLPKDLRAALLSKDNIDKVFASTDGKAIKDLVMTKILKPILMEQASLDSPVMAAGLDSVKDRVIKLLASSPEFGDQIIKKNIQNKIDAMGGFTKFMAKVLYGGNSLTWDKVRVTPDGKKAEDYIREKILLPKFQGLTLTKDQEKKFNEEAELFVKDAIKKYDE